MTTPVISDSSGQPAADRKAPDKKRSRKWDTAIALIAALVGIAVMLYPVVATVVNNHTQSRQARVYTEQIETSFTPEERAAEMQEAREWNEAHQGGPILDPWLARISEDNADYQHYLEQLNLTQAMGRIVIPEISSDLPIYHGTSESTLEKGIGHLYGSSLPTGGEGTHSLLTGHTGLSSATLWDDLDKLEIGDAVYIDVVGEKMKYEIHNIDVVLPHETDHLRPVEGEDLLTLITCTPYAVNTHRLLLTAHRVPMDEEVEAYNTITTPWQWWMTAVLIIAGIALIIMISLMIKNYRNNRAARMIEQPLVEEG
ncbi:class C sortase [Corynebacterium cystitidis]|uniref:class C sortase n=1 Tax=Corynebacterium cystitidis TaxID=35757 RepID=UPI00211DA64A|nr:class C sortase [Corynebacterium cystitidis]